MKTMTCKQMGGPCDTPIQGSTADEMMNNGAAHVKEMADAGDEAHKQVLVMMEKTKTDPEAGKEWMDKFAKDFAALSDN